MFSDLQIVRTTIHFTYSLLCIFQNLILSVYFLGASRFWIPVFQCDLRPGLIDYVKNHNHDYFVTIDNIDFFLKDYLKVLYIVEITLLW